MKVKKKCGGPHAGNLAYFAASGSLGVEVGGCLFL